MLTYLMKTISYLIIPAFMIGMAFPYYNAFYGKWGKRITWIGIGHGLLFGLVFAIIDNTTRLKNAWKYTVATFLLILIPAVIFTVFTIVSQIKPIRKKIGPKPTFILDLVTASIGALAIGQVIYYVIPDVYYMPWGFYSSDTGILSSEYLLSLGGYLLGILICIFICWIIAIMGDLTVKKNNKWVVMGYNFAFSLIMVAYTFFKAMSFMIAKKLIFNGNGKFRITMFSMSANVNNHKEVLVYICIGIAVLLAAYLVYLSLTRKEPYKNPAEARKIKATWLSHYRNSGMLAVLMIVVVFSFTWFVQLNTTSIVEAPTEDPVVQGDTLYVTLDRVNDGHLHRFGYKTEDGYMTRFIIVKKPNGTAYGVGLDACEICGEAGYYERQDQIVCKRCDVVMNTNTIGFKGGCNPIVIDYQVTDTYIAIPISELVKYETKFSK